MGALYPLSMPAPETNYFVGVCGGEIGYDFDMPDVMHRVSTGRYAYIVIDRAVGGHGQDIVSDRIKQAVCDLVSHPRCMGVGLSPREL